ncbi:VanZ family protein [Tropicimonas marinistellae]|uniref:VanZ family protein n=1 Tax=Tropicimonas marinistellae TaxID=1739787 RepID=UPI00083739CF|nr:VanZ family protein [Tropicimonas marinistellae]
MRYAANPEQENQWIVVVATVLLGILIAIATLAPITILPEFPAGMDKSGHVAAFAALTFPAALLRPRLLMWFFPVCVLFGGLIEIIQPHFGRQVEFHDFLADAIGATFGVGFGFLIRALTCPKAIYVQPER